MNTTPRLLTGALLSVIGLSCAAASHAAGPTTAPASAIATTFRFDAAVDPGKLEGDDHHLSLQKRLELSHSITLYFAQLDKFDEDGNVSETSPVVIYDLNGKKLGLMISDPRLTNGQWSFVATGPKRNEIWGILDHGLEDVAPTLLLAHSTDAAATWTVSPLIKPDPRATFDSCCIAKDGHGRLTLYLTTDDSPDHAGFYHWDTTDFGQSWHGPRYEPDSLTSAEDVPEEDQSPTARQISAHLSPPHPLLHAH